MTYKVELIDKKDPLWQLKASKSSIKDFFNDLLDEAKGFKYQITVTILLKKYKGTENEFSPVYFNSTTKTLINHKFGLERITQKDKEMINDLDYKGIEFTISKKDFHKIEVKNEIYISVFCYENKLTYPIYVSDQRSENLMDLLLISNENKSHYVYIKDFGRFMFSKTKSKSKKYFCKSCWQCFSNKNVLTEHKKICLKISGEKL